MIGINPADPIPRPQGFHTAPITNPARLLGKGANTAIALGPYVHQYPLYNLTAGQRAVHMLAYTEQYLPPKVYNFFASGNKFTQSAGKYVAESFGYFIEDGQVPGAAKGVKSWSRMGENRGFMGAKSVAEKGLKGISFTGVLVGATTLAFTADYAYDGWQENGIVGAAGGVAQATIDAFIFRKAVPPVLGKSWAGVKAGASAGRGMLAGFKAASWAGKAGKLGAAAVKGVSFGLGGAAAGLLMSPWAWVAGGGLYAMDSMLEVIEDSNRGNAKLRQIEALDMGRPITDQFGTISTLRQRSLSALQNSHVNGRMALGNEAALLH